MIHSSRNDFKCHLKCYTITFSRYCPSAIKKWEIIIQLIKYSSKRSSHNILKSFFMFPKPLVNFTARFFPMRVWLLSFCITQKCNNCHSKKSFCEKLREDARFSPIKKNFRLRRGHCTLVSHKWRVLGCHCCIYNNKFSWFFKWICGLFQYKCVQYSLYYMYHCSYFRKMIIEEITRRDM